MGSERRHAKQNVFRTDWHHPIEGRGVCTELDKWRRRGLGGRNLGSGSRCDYPARGMQQKQCLVGDFGCDLLGVVRVQCCNLVLVGDLHARQCPPRRFTLTGVLNVMIGTV